ncbi:MAG: VWA domain-containing protein, partial [Gemmatimonadota bacterium]
MTLTWSYPFALLLLLLIPLHLRLVRQSAASVPLPRAAELRQAAAATLFAVLPAALRVGVLIVLALAVAGPTSTGAVVEEPREGIPIALAIDISSSMLAQDFAPRDRLTVAKTTLASFVEARDGDPISLVALAGEALTLIPATTNRPLLLNAIASLQVGLLGDGTAIGDGLAVAVNRLRQLGDQPGVIVLLSDGENNRGTVDPLDAADAAASLGIR